ncbi:MAG: F0F1 ATP synthase subunit epsilon [Clostridia bacterium]|nr:F0F1 ATP synthase subunit epsilon [Clostridia bacterium]
MALIHLTIVTPEGKHYDAQAQRIRVRTTGGDVAILPHHIDYAAALAQGEAKVTDPEGNERYALVDGGILHVANDEVQVIANRFEWKDQR